MTGFFGSVVNLAYLVTAFLFIMGLKRMSSPKTARGGILWAGAGMVVATVVTFVHPDMGHAHAVNFVLILIAMAIGGSWAWLSGKRVAMTDMPQMIALYNGMGGGAAAAIAAVELFSGNNHGAASIVLAVVGALIGTISFSGSLIAYGKLQGLIKRAIRFNGQQVANLALFGLTVLIGLYIIASGSTGSCPSCCSSCWPCCSAWR